MDSTKKPQIENPRHKANSISQLFFIWIIPLLYVGSKRGLNTDDLTKTLDNDNAEELGDLLEKNWEIEQNKAKQNNRKPHLRNAMFKTFYKSSLLDGIFIFIFVMLKTLLPVVLAQLLGQYHEGKVKLIEKQSLNVKNLDDIDAILSTKSEEDVNFLNYIWNDIIWLTGIIFLMSLVSVTIAHHADLRQRMIGARMRIACCSAIYRKTLRLSKQSNSDTTTGYVVNLLSNDVSRLDIGFVFSHYIWILPIQSVLICYLIWQEIGIAALVGVLGLLLKTVPVQTGLSSLSSKLRMKVALRTDKRVGIMNELIQGIQVIKMYAWEKPFQSVVAESRRQEIKQIRYASYIRGVYLSTMVFTERSTLFITIAACILLGHTIRADVVFSMAQFFNMLQLLAAIYYPLAVSFGGEALVSIRRVQKFLMQEEHDSSLNGLTIDKNANVEILKIPIIEIIDITASWKETKRKTLEKINFNVNSGKLLAIIGPVGSGKSSIFQLILGELPVISGTVKINGELSYGSQQPWLFPGTVRNNILFGLPFDKKRYQSVVEHCALMTDFQQLPNGDKTIVGERGSSLSGGQRARISLARAVYKKANIYMLDDPLSAVDAHVGKHLFDEVIGADGFLAKNNATRILITHQVHFLKDADWIVIIEQGKVSRQGTYSDLANSDLDFAKILEKSEVIENSEEENANIENFILDDGQDNEHIPFIDGANEYPTVRQRLNSEKSISLSQSKSSSMLELATENAEEQAEGGVSLKVWSRYFRAGGSLCLLFFLAFVLIASQFITSGSDYFVNIWTQQEFLRSTNQSAMFTTHEGLYIYGSLILSVVAITILRSYMFFKICMTASKCLHNKMFTSILLAPMRFFDTNSGGRILNRFSRDMGAIDERLPSAMMEAIQILLVMVGILTMVVVLNPSLVLALVVAIIFYIFVLKIYLRPAQDLKRLEGIVRSPVFGHLSATLDGLSIIRANGVEKKLSEEFDNLQNVHSAVWQLTMASNNACGLWLDYISATFVGAVAFSFALFQQDTFAGNVGLAISQALILTGMVQFGVRQTVESIQQMTSVERVLQYSDIKPENSPNKRPVEQWPQNGHIKFNNMSMRYDVNSTPILKNITIDIKAGWKVGIVGRTGAGKSSLIGALFRLAVIDGGIIIDDIDTGTISLDSLRQKISIIPQDPVLFSATIRYNLDPFGLFTDEMLWNVLVEVELKQDVGHLDYMVTEGGNNFSVGQRQLICLARAILRNNKMLVLDEATANVDPQTDALIQKTIRVKFVHCTVLTIAHRLHTVMDSDRILVMEAGSAKEFDIPHTLLKDKNSLLSNMVESTGLKEAESLRKVAASCYQSILDKNIS